VDEAGNGEEAMAQVRRNNYDLILCDIKMPTMDGYELLRNVRNENKWMTTPFLFLSALTERDDKVKAHTNGCDAYLTKPIDFSVLDAMVRSQIERQQLRDVINYSTIGASQHHIMSALDDALMGPLADAGAILQHLRETVPVLTPSALDEYLASMQMKINAHIVELHTFHHTLELQSSTTERRHDAILAEDLIQSAMAECAYHCPSMPTRYKSPESNGVMVHGDKHLLQRAFAGLLAAVPEAHETKNIVRYTADRTQASITIADNPLLLLEEDFVQIDATTDLVRLSEVTRHRLASLTHAVQVAQAHDGQFEIMVWSEDRLAVRLILPQLKRA
jgi:CheY-like chemotaxis protein